MPGDLPNIRALFPDLVRIADAPCILPPKTPCWIWLGDRDIGGYGTLIFDGDTWQAHRLSFRHVGGLRRGFYVCHRCDIKSCVNHEHLVQQRPRENSRDRWRSEETLAPDIVKAIAGSKLYSETLAKMYRLRVEQVEYIKRIAR